MEDPGADEGEIERARPPEEEAPQVDEEEGALNDRDEIDAVAAAALGASIRSEEADAASTAVAVPVSDDEPVSIAVRIRDASTAAGGDEETAGQRRRSSFDSFQAACSLTIGAAPVLEIQDPAVVESHPNAIARKIHSDIRSFYWQRVAFQVCVVVSLLGVALGLGLGLSRSNAGDDGGSSGAQGNVTLNEEDAEWTPTAPPSDEEACVDDPTWTGKFPGSNCETVALNPLLSCPWWTGFVPAGGPPDIRADAACVRSCTTCDGVDPTRRVVPLTKPAELECVNDMEWRNLRDFDCEWVAAEPGGRCGLPGKNATQETYELAYLACPVACFDECRESRESI